VNVVNRINRVTRAVRFVPHPTALGLGPTDWTGVTPDGTIIVNGPNGDAEEAGHESDF